MSRRRAARRLGSSSPRHRRLQIEQTGFVRTPEAEVAELVELVGHVERLAEELGMVEVVVRARRVRRLLEVLRDSEGEDGIDRQQLTAR